MKRSKPLRRTPLKRGSSQLRRSRIAPVSKKRQAERQARRDVIDDTWARAGGRCQAADVWPEIRCWGPLDTDEIVSRAQRPGGHLDSTNTQLLCRAHHDARHAQPIEAAHRGLRPYPVGYTGPRREA